MTYDAGPTGYLLSCGALLALAEGVLVLRGSEIQGLNLW